MDAVVDADADADKVEHFIYDYGFYYHYGCYYYYYCYDSFTFIPSQ